MEWKDGFGNDTFAHLVYPPDYQRRSRYPLVVVQYRSRGFLNGGVGDEYPIYPLAANGFLVLSFDRPNDWNLSAHYRENTLAAVAASEAEEWKDGYKERRKLSALGIILERLDRRGIVDPKRVGITGLSDGADTVNYALFSSNLFAAAAMSGDWSPAYYSLTTSDAMRSLIRGFLQVGSGDQVVEKWAPLSIVCHAGAVAAPLLIQVSDTELLQTAPIYVALKDAGKPVEAYVFPDENHIKWQPQHKLAVAERAIDWFSFWLQDREDMSPTKLDQYKRWRQLRTLGKVPPVDAAAKIALACSGECTQ
jgi:dienelactone hydrolase